MYRSPPKEDPLDQGDIFWDCPIPFLATKPPRSPRAKGQVSVHLKKAVVLTQSLDLALKQSGKLSEIVVAPLFTRDELQLTQEQYERIRNRKGLGFYFLTKCPSKDPHSDFRESIVDLRRLYSIPRSRLEHLVSQGARKLAIKSPFREDLSMAFAFTYFRIGHVDEAPDFRLGLTKPTNEKKA